jgi:hypothetical protein
LPAGQSAREHDDQYRDTRHAGNLDGHQNLDQPYGRGHDIDGITDLPDARHRHQYEKVQAQFALTIAIAY